MFSRQNIPDKGLICKILRNKELAGKSVPIRSESGISCPERDPIFKENCSGSEVVLRLPRSVAPLQSSTKWTEVVCDVRHRAFVTFVFPFWESEKDCLNIEGVSPLCSQFVSLN
jgi:hypothetical protein